MKLLYLIDYYQSEIINKNVYPDGRFKPLFAKTKT
jgi:hypothetical protein